MCLVTERCKSCYFSSANRAGYDNLADVTCDYYLIMHKRRGCPAGDKCDKYKPGEREKKIHLGGLKNG